MTAWGNLPSALPPHGTVLAWARGCRAMNANPGTSVSCPNWRCNGRCGFPPSRKLDTDTLARLEPAMSRAECPCVRRAAPSAVPQPGVPPAFRADLSRTRKRPVTGDPTIRRPQATRWPGFTAHSRTLLPAASWPSGTPIAPHTPSARTLPPFCASAVASQRAGLHWTEPADLCVVACLSGCRASRYSAGGGDAGSVGMPRAGRSGLTCGRVTGPVAMSVWRSPTPGTRS
jgi:hypothetical protein